MKVRRFPHDPGPAAWNAILPPAPGHPILEGECQADWLIIGAGFAGLSAAKRLRQLQPKGRIVVLEARQIAEGPAGRNSGFMIDLPHDIASEEYGGDLENDRQQTAMNREAIEFAQSLSEEYDLGKEAFIASGKVNGAATEKGLKHNTDYARHLDRLSESYEILDAFQMKEMTGTTYYSGGLYTPGTAMIQPALYMLGLGQGLQREGVQIFEHSPAMTLDRTDGTWVVKTPNGRAEAPSVILAVNGHAGSFGYFEQRLMPVYTYGSMSRALTEQEIKTLGGNPVWGCAPSDPLGTTVRRIAGTGGHRIIVRNTFDYVSSMAVSKERLAKIAREQTETFNRRFPMLTGLEMEFCWGGQLCLSRNNVAAFKQLDEGLISACCQNGIGVAKGTLAGMAAAEQATGSSSQLTARLLDEPMPQKLPPSPIAQLGATAVIRWGEWKAGRER